MDFEEMEIAFRAQKEIDAGLAICSFACAPEGRLSSGTPLVEAFTKLRDLGAKIVGVNCMNGPHGTVQLLQRVPAEFLLSAFPNAGYPKYHEGRFIYHTAPEYFAQSAREMVAEGARLLGGCCGTNPTHVAAIASAIAEFAASAQQTRARCRRAATRTPAPESSRRRESPRQACTGQTRGYLRTRSAEDVGA